MLGQPFPQAVVRALNEELLRQRRETERARREEVLNRHERRNAARERFDTLNSEWDVFESVARAEGRVGFSDRRSRPYIARARELTVNPGLDDNAKDGLQKFLHEHDVVRPDVLRRFRTLFQRWNELRALAKARDGS